MPNPNENSPLSICSHKRSGTHFLLATIWENFILPDMNINAPIPHGKSFRVDKNISKPGDRADIPWGALWSTHNFYNPAWVKNPEKILYIVRHPVDTLLSFWRFQDPRVNQDPFEFLDEGRVKFWYKHAKGYTRNCFWIRYEDLMGAGHDNVLDEIQTRFSLERKHEQYQRVLKRVGWYTDKPTNRLGNQSALIEEVISVCKTVLPEGFLGYDIEKPKHSFKGGENAKL